MVRRLERDGTAFESRWLPLRRVTLVDNRYRRNFSCAIGKMILRLKLDLFPLILPCRN